MHLSAHVGVLGHNLLEFIQSDANDKMSFSHLRMSVLQAILQQPRLRSDEQCRHSTLHCGCEQPALL